MIHDLRQRLSEIKREMVFWKKQQGNEVRDKILANLERDCLEIQEKLKKVEVDGGRKI